MTKSINFNREPTSTSAEMYNYNTDRYSKRNSYTLQQSTRPEGSDDVSVGAPAAPFIPSPSGSRAGEEDREEIQVGLKRNTAQKPKFIQRKITTEDKIVNIWIGTSNLKVGNRFSRMAAYICLQEEKDKKYSMFYRSKLTTAHDEIRRGIIEKDNRALLEVFNDFESAFGKDCFMGRLRLNPRKYPINEQHRSNHKNGLLCIVKEKTGYLAILYLLGEYYNIHLDTNLTDSQSNYYETAGIWELDEEDEHE
jgi:hypothetical protein